MSHSKHDRKNIDTGIDLSALTISQRAALAAENLGPFEAEAKQRQLSGLRRGNVTRHGAGEGGAPAMTKHGDASDFAGKAYGVSSRSVRSAKRVMNQRPDLFEQIKSGEISVNGATQLARHGIDNPEADVYAIAAPCVGKVKFGVSMYPETRRLALSTGSPVPLKIIGILPGGGFIDEKRLHEKFAAHHSHGEWYDLVPEIEAEISGW